VRRFAVCALRWALAAVAAATAAQAFAQAYPSKPVRMVVPLQPGGGLDAIARILAERAGQAWNQPVVVENRPGASFTLGTNLVARSPADGYTIALTSSSAISIAPVVYKDLPYEPLRDLTPVTLVTYAPFALLINGAVPAKSVSELLAHLRANPGRLNLASSSASTLLASELLKAMAGVDYADINYKGGAPAAASTVAGETQMSFVEPLSARNAAFLSRASHARRIRHSRLRGERLGGCAGARRHPRRRGR
jgi:tripartite-type tricarboxylate transporter receptor subunit TctC